MRKLICIIIIIVLIIELLRSVVDSVFVSFNLVMLIGMNILEEEIFFLSLFEIL